MEFTNVRDGSPLFLQPSKIEGYTKWDKESFPTIYMLSGREFLVRESLDELEQKLDF